MDKMGVVFSDLEIKMTEFKRRWWVFHEKKFMITREELTTLGVSSDLTGWLVVRQIANILNAASYEITQDGDLVLER